MRRERWLPFAPAVYLLLLAGSHVVRRVAETPDPPADLAVVEVELGDAIAGTVPARLAYRRWESGDVGRRPQVLLLHGSPGSSRDFEALGRNLATERRVIAPDLPGFGFSDNPGNDTSIVAHAHAAAALIEGLNLGTVDVIGFSMGGGVAIELADRRPELVRSLTLVSSIGVQEFELLGDYFLNHAVHGLQLAALWALHEAVPHFGLLDRFPLDVAYARNFYDTDQRPLRGILARLTPPVLIVHGRRDVLVPSAAAVEHHRLVPQSELALLEGGHFLLFRAAPSLVAPIADFLERVGEGRARSRAEATDRRLLESRAPFDPSSVPAATGVALIALLVLIATATFVSEDATCIAAGLLVAQGRLGFLAASAACAAGILLGDLLIYAAGRLLGRPWLHRAPVKWIISPRSLARGAAWFERRGPVVILASRFLPGTRVATYFSAGLFKTDFLRFLGYFVLAVILWTPILVGLAAWLGVRFFSYFEAFERWAIPAAIVLAFGVTVMVRLLRRLATWNGRRRLLASIRRKLEWEFWPWWLIYVPVVPWIAWLGMRHRGMTLFTVANPGIEAGGFVGESKAAILGQIDPRWVARFRKIRGAEPLSERLAAARDFVEREQLEFPLVLKPDVGERGSGFRIVRSAAALEESLAKAERDLLLQEYIGGVELGIFYVRRPSEERGSIFSITEKRLLRLRGDGVSNVERLILADPRAMRLAPIHLDKMAGELERVPAPDEEIPLVELGVHSRGALFLDGSCHLTPELEATIDGISRSFEGFFFGRYDLRAPSYQSFRNGRDLKVLELNGVTSEATHIYDPENSYLDALRILRRQWELAFEIAAENRGLGSQPVGVGELLELVWRARRR